MENTSGLKPLGRAVLIKPYRAEDAVVSKLIAIPDSVKGNMMLLEQKAIVIAVGESCWHDEPVKRAAPGDHVIVTKFAGYMALGDDDEQYRLINDRDVFAQLVGVQNEDL